MFGKLLKYDFRSMWKQFSVIWPAALLLGLINRFTTDGAHGASEVGELTAVISMTLFISVFVAMAIVSVVFVLNRFYKGLLGDEGYLMHTLPVKTWQLVLSKLVCALAVTVVNMIVAFLAMFLMMPLKWEGIFDPRFWNMLVRGLWEQPDTILYLVEFFLMFLAMFAMMFTMIYLSMAIGHLFSKRRIFKSVAAFFGIYILGSIIISSLHNMNLYLLDWAMYLTNHLACWAWIGLMLVPTVLMFLGTSYILKNHLNLE